MEQQIIIQQWALQCHETLPCALVGLLVGHATGWSGILNKACQLKGQSSWNGCLYEDKQVASMSSTIKSYAQSTTVSEAKAKEDSSELVLSIFQVNLPVLCLLESLALSPGWEFGMLRIAECGQILARGGAAGHPPATLLAPSHCLWAVISWTCHTSNSTHCEAEKPPNIHLRPCFTGLWPRVAVWCCGVVSQGAREALMSVNFVTKVVQEAICPIVECGATQAFKGMWSKSMKLLPAVSDWPSTGPTQAGSSSIDKHLSNPTLKFQKLNLRPSVCKHVHFHWTRRRD